MEAVPACVKVANYRYQELVKTILNLERLGGYQGIVQSIEYRYQDLIETILNLERLGGYQGIV